MPKAKENETSDVQQLLFEPIKGYPMLHWQGKRPFTSTQYYPAQLKEQHGEPVDGWFNEIYWGDNLQVMSHLLKIYRGKMNLIYIDPPFDSKADYKKKIELRGQKLENNYNSFEEKQYGDIWTNDEYLQFMYERIILLKELLSESGCIYVHCDWHRNHLLKCIMDEIFSQELFINEIIWKRSGVHASKIGFGPVHDTILLYSKSKDFVWNPQFAEYDEEYRESWFNKIDEKGRKYGLVICSAPGDRKGTKAHYQWKGIWPPAGRHWAVTEEKMKELEKLGLIEYSSNKVPYARKYLDESPGIPVNDIWTDTGHIKSKSFENENYPTQKPGALLERIINASSNPGDIVFDCFMGAGTTQAVAMKLGRKFIGADINLGAIQITTKRLISVAKDLDATDKQMQFTDNDKEIEIVNFFTGFSVYNVNHYDFFRNQVEARDLLMEALEIQPLPRNTVYDGEKDGFMVKIMPVDRIATRRDLNELISNVDYKTFNKRKDENPGKPVEKILLVCMGHEPDIAAVLKQEIGDYDIDVKVVDILRDRSCLEFKRDSEAKIKIKKEKIVIEKFYPMNLLQKLSLMKQDVKDWRELVESVMIDWNFDGDVFKPGTMDVPEKSEIVKGEYQIPKVAKKIKVKITDLLSESYEEVIDNA